MADGQADMARSRVSFFFGWGLPILVLISLNFLTGMVPAAAIIVVLAAMLAWMGIACLMNARRCGRRHCFYSGPILLAGAAAALLLGFRVIDLGAEGLNYVLLAVLGLVGLSYASEWVWGKYRISNR